MQAKLVPSPQANSQNGEPLARGQDLYSVYKKGNRTSARYCT
jgi:hypothetical protein